MHKSKTREDIVSLIKQLKKLGCSPDELRRPKVQSKVLCSNGQDYMHMIISEHTTVETLKQFLADAPDHALINISPNDDEDFGNDVYFLSIDHVIGVSDHVWKYSLNEMLEKLTNTVEISFNGQRRIVPKEVALRMFTLFNRDCMMTP